MFPWGEVVSNLYLEKLSILNSVFVPFAPVESRDIFIGRAKQIQKCLEAATQRGRHIVFIWRQRRRENFVCEYR